MYIHIYIHTYIQGIDLDYLIQVNSLPPVYLDQEPASNACIKARNAFLGLVSEAKKWFWKFKDWSERLLVQSIGVNPQMI